MNDHSEDVSIQEDVMDEIFMSTEVTDEIIRDIRLIDKQINALQTERFQLRSWLLTLIGRCVHISDKDGTIVATAKEVVSSRLDTTSLKNEQPEIYNKYLKEGFSRVLRLTKET